MMRFSWIYEESITATHTVLACKIAGRETAVIIHRLAESIDEDKLREGV